MACCCQNQMLLNSRVSPALMLGNLHVAIKKNGVMFAMCFCLSVWQRNSLSVIPVVLSLRSKRPDWQEKPVECWRIWRPSLAIHKVFCQKHRPRDPQKSLAALTIQTCDYDTILFFFILFISSYHSTIAWHLFFVRETQSHSKHQSDVGAEQTL